MVLAESMAPPTKHAFAPAAPSPPPPPPLIVTSKLAGGAGAVAAAVAPSFPSTPPRKLAQLLATSAPSRSGSDARLQAETPRSGWRSALWPSSPVFRKKLQLVAPSNQSPVAAKVRGGTSNSTNNNKNNNKNNNSKSERDLTRALERELAAPIPLSLKARSDRSEPQDDFDFGSVCRGEAEGRGTGGSAPHSAPGGRAGLDFSQLARQSALRSLSALESAAVEAARPPVMSVRLHGGELQVQSAPPQTPALKPAAKALGSPKSPESPESPEGVSGLVTPPSSPLATATASTAAELSAKRSSLAQELEEFAANPEAQIVMFPEYFADAEKELVRQAAEALRLGCQIGERNVAVFKTGEACARARSRSSASSGDGAADDVFVDVSELAQQGKDCFIARLRLRRLSSGSGVRRKLLWDVAELAQRDALAADPVGEGDGGVYAVQARAGGPKLAMFKPAEEERFVREGLAPGEGAVREEAAYVLDARSGGFSGVPPTAVARLQLAAAAGARHGAVQRFMASNLGSMEGFGMPRELARAEAFVPVEQVHRIGLLDVRVFNTDRHPGNLLLIGERAPYTMAPIDHGCILPSWFHLSEARFDWLEYPQARAPFAPAALAHVAALDADADARALRRLGIREECVTTLRICTLFLQRAARAGRSLFWIGSFMQRQGCFEAPSGLELLVQRACAASGVPFAFERDAFGEQKGRIAPGVLSRRPPRQFFDALDALVCEAVAGGGGDDE